MFSRLFILVSVCASLSVLKLMATTVDAANLACTKHIIYDGAYYNIFQQYAPVGYQPMELGHGQFGVVVTGMLPRGFEREIMRPPGTNWRAGTLVAVKTAKDEERGAPIRNSLSIAHEGQIVEKLMALDPRNEIFLRTAYDKRRNLLIMNYSPQVITLEKWLTPDYAQDHTAENKAAIERQLRRGLEALKQAGLVHSDLKPANLLINRKTLKVWFYDYSMTAPEGGYAEHLGNQIREGSHRYASPNQKANRPAAYSDDEYSITKILEDIDRAVTKRTSPR